MHHPFPGAVTIRALIAVLLFALSNEAAASMFSSRAAWEQEVAEDIGRGSADVNLAAQVADLATLPAGTPIALGPFEGLVMFDITLTGRQVPTSWPSWSDGATPRVLFTGGATTLHGTFLASDQYGFGLEVQPEVGVQQFTLLLDDGSSLTQLVSSLGGAAFLGFSDNLVRRWTVSCDTCSLGSGFAVGEFVQAAPLPGALALVILGLASVLGLEALRARRGP